jgi:hypothetical protein
MLWDCGWKTAEQAFGATKRFNVSSIRCSGSCYLLIYVHLSTCQDASSQRDVIDFKSTGEPGSRAEFTYHMTPATISITGKGRLSVGKDLEAVLRKIEYWHQAPVTKFRIMARQGQGTWHGVRWDGKEATAFILNETDENKAMQALLLEHPIEEAGSPSDREIDANQKPVMSDRDKNLFIEQHKDGYAILRGGVKEPLAVETTQDAAIEKARKLDPDAAIHVERVRNVEGGGRDKWRRV